MLTFIYRRVLNACPAASCSGHFPLSFFIFFYLLDLCPCSTHAQYVWGEGVGGWSHGMCGIVYCIPRTMQGPTQSSWPFLSFTKLSPHPRCFTNGLLSPHPRCFTNGLLSPHPRCFTNGLSVQSIGCVWIVLYTYSWAGFHRGVIILQCSPGVGVSLGEIPTKVRARSVLIIPPWEHSFPLRNQAMMCRSMGQICFPVMPGSL
jgi:hypothetical protein